MLWYRSLRCESASANGNSAYHCRKSGIYYNLIYYYRTADRIIFSKKIAKKNMLGAVMAVIDYSICLLNENFLLEKEIFLYLSVPFCLQYIF